MAQPEQLIRFILRKTLTRGVIIQMNHIREEAAKIHQLNDVESELFSQVMAGSILLLSISKGGIRQVMQLDGHGASIQRISSESRQGAVRGYINWGTSRQVTEANLSALGDKAQLSTIRDSGVGQPYISTVDCPKHHLADALLHYTRQSVQTQADFVLHKNTAIMIEAMPKCSESQWFESIEALAAIRNTTLEQNNATDILNEFDALQCHILGKDDYRYQCQCKPEIMARALENLDRTTLKSLENEQGNVTLSCQYCAKKYHLNPDMNHA